MEKEEILAKIEKIKDGIEADAGELIREKIQQREWKLQKSGRGFLLAPVIDWLRRRLLVEINHIFEPILDNQKEINLRLLKEIEKIKKSHEPSPQNHSRPPAPESKKASGQP